MTETEKEKKPQQDTQKNLEISPTTSHRFVSSLALACFLSRCYFATEHNALFSRYVRDAPIHLPAQQALLFGQTSLVFRCKPQQLGFSVQRRLRPLLCRAERKRALTPQLYTYILEQVSSPATSVAFGRFCVCV